MIEFGAGAVFGGAAVYFRAWIWAKVKDYAGKAYDKAFGWLFPSHM